MSVPDYVLPIHTSIISNGGLHFVKESKDEEGIELGSARQNGRDYI